MIQGVRASKESVDVLTYSSNQNSTLQQKTNVKSKPLPLKHISKIYRGIASPPGKQYTQLRHSVQPVALKLSSGRPTKPKRNGQYGSQIMFQPINTRCNDSEIILG